MKIKTSELEGAALDYMTGVAFGEYVQVNPTLGIKAANPVLRRGRRYRPSTDWSQGGPLIAVYGVWLSDDATDEPRGPWIGSVGGGYLQYGEHPLVAACRAIVAAHLGDEVDVPEELV